MELGTMYLSWTLTKKQFWQIRSGSWSWLQKLVFRFTVSCIVTLRFRWFPWFPPVSTTWELILVKCLGGARVLVGAEDAAAGRVGEMLAREACRGFPQCWNKKGWLETIVFIESSSKYFLWSISDFVNLTHWSANVNLNLDPTRCTCFWHICFVVTQYSAPNTTRNYYYCNLRQFVDLTPLDLWAYRGSCLFNSGAVFWGLTFISRRTMNENIIPCKKNNINLWTCSHKQTTLWCSCYTGTVCIHISIAMCCRRIVLSYTSCWIQNYCVYGALFKLSVRFLYV